MSLGFRWVALPTEALVIPLWVSKRINKCSRGKRTGRSRLGRGGFRRSTLGLSSLRASDCFAAGALLGLLLSKVRPSAFLLSFVAFPASELVTVVRVPAWR